MKLSKKSHGVFCPLVACNISFRPFFLGHADMRVCVVFFSFPHRLQDSAGKLKPRWTFLESILDCEAGTVVTATVLLMTLFMGAFWVVMKTASEHVHQATWWAILLIIFFLGCSACCFVVICFHQQSSVELSFKVKGHFIRCCCCCRYS